MAALVVACGQRRLCAEHNLQVGLVVVVGVGAVESRDNHRSLVHVGPLNLVGREQYNARCPLVAVDAQILAPLLHHLIIYNVRSPQVAVDAIVCGGLCSPFPGIESRQRVGYATLGHGLHLWGVEGKLAGQLLYGPRGADASPGNGGRDGRPVVQIARLGLGAVRPEDVVLLACFVPYHRGIVHADTRGRMPGVEALQVGSGELALGRQRRPGQGSQQKQEGR